MDQVDRVALVARVVVSFSLPKMQIDQPFQMVVVAKEKERCAVEAEMR